MSHTPFFYETQPGSPSFLLTNLFGQLVLYGDWSFKVFPSGNSTFGCLLKIRVPLHLSQLLNDLNDAFLTILHDTHADGSGFPHLIAHKSIGNIVSNSDSSILVIDNADIRIAVIIPFTQYIGKNPNQHLAWYYFLHICFLISIQNNGLQMPVEAKTALVEYYTKFINLEDISPKYTLNVKE